ncbi:3-oxoacyl-ACP synthase III family protein, partial [Christiangramia echinicola]|uniref:3-oxoacyl-ACP synthase III family protein n=1 Tax=Christiangramia echinicola TaxID=279359 RepID=UPI0004245AF1
MAIIISSAGSYIPDEVISNKGLSEKFDQPFDIENWILDKTGILERRKSNLKPSEQGFLAAKEMKLKDGEIDFIIVNTFTGDYTLPQTATLIQEKLGLKKAFAFEINMPCAGPVYALSMAEMFLKSGRYKKGLLIGVDKMLDAIDPDDFLMNVLFGEGAGAIVV